MEILKDIYGIIGCGMILIGVLLVFFSLCDTKIEMYMEKLKNERLTKELEQIKNKTTMNELNEKIQQILLDEGYGTDTETVKSLSKFFLEEIKEAFEKGWSLDMILPEELDEEINDYLKSKYKI